MSIEAPVAPAVEQSPLRDRSRFNPEQQKLLHRIDTYNSHLENPAIQAAEVLQILQKRHDELSNKLQKSTHQLSEETQIPQSLRSTFLQLSTTWARINELKKELQIWDGISEDHKPKLKTHELSLLLQIRKNALQEQIKTHKLSEDEAQPQLLALAGQAIELTTGMKLRDSQYVTAFALIHGMPTDFSPEYEENSKKINGRLVEKKSGEGKTLAVGAATIASAMITQTTNEAAHVMPPNDYLSKRDLSLLGKAYEACGLKAGIVLYGGKEQYLFDSSKESGDPDYPHLISVRNNPLDLSEARRLVYSQSDIIYGTIQTFMVDELQDNQQVDLRLKRQVRISPEGTYRSHVKAVALLDEADQTLIDQAEIPVRLAYMLPRSPDQEQLLMKANNYATKLRAPIYVGDNRLLTGDYEVLDVGDRDPTIRITEKGFAHLKRLIRKDHALPQNPNKPGQDPLDYFLFETHPEYYDAIHNAILANAQTFKGGNNKDGMYRYKKPSLVRFQEGKEIVVRNNQVVLLDRYTNRVLEDTRIEGLHQAIEAMIKATPGNEDIEISGEQITLDEISIQSYIRSYRWRSGTTGTALFGEKILKRIYNLDVVKIPSDFESQLIILPTIITKTQVQADTIVVDQILERQIAGNKQPLLILASSVTHAEELSHHLEQVGIHPTLLTARSSPEEEARIVSQAGTLNTITIATTIAGRGTDITFGEGVEQLDEILVDALGQREQQQARDRIGRQGHKGFFQKITSRQSDFFRQVGKDQSMRGLFSNLDGHERARSMQHRRTLHSIAYGPQGPSLPYEQPNLRDFLGNDNMLGTIQKEEESKKLDSLELVVHADHVVDSNRKHFQRSRDRFRNTFRSDLWIREATATLLPRIIHARIDNITKGLETFTGNQQEDRTTHEALLNEALTLHIPANFTPQELYIFREQLRLGQEALQELPLHEQANPATEESYINDALTVWQQQPSGQIVGQPIATVEEIDAYLRKTYNNTINIVHMSSTQQQRFIMEYLQVGKERTISFATVSQVNDYLSQTHEPNTDLLRMSPQEQKNAIIRYLQKNLTKRPFSQVQLKQFMATSQQIYQHVWQQHLATVQDIYASVFQHTKPLTDYTIASSHDLQTRLNAISERMLVHAIELTRWKQQTTA